MNELRDSFGRRIDYLRVSITDRCNLRCVYCLPRAGTRWQPLAQMLSGDELLRAIRTAAALGVRRIRFTGGEPLVFPGLVDLVRGAAAIDGVDEISLTTNGLRLEALAAPLADAGLKRINVSVDTLVPEKFRRITRGGDLRRVWRGLAAAERCGLAPLKLNVVVVRGLNDDELCALAQQTQAHPWHVRFIELMPVGNEGDWGAGFPAAPDRYLSVQDMQARLAPLGLAPDPGPVGNGPARSFRLPGALGTVGFISPLGDHFCAACNRLRLTADGRLRPCLLLDQEVPVRDALRSGADIAGHFALAVAQKPEHHELLSVDAERQRPQNRAMCQIGG